MYVYIFSAQKVNSKRILLFTCNDDPHVGNTHLQVSVVWLIWVNLWVAAFSFLSREIFFIFFLKFGHLASYKGTMVMLT